MVWFRLVNFRLAGEEIDRIADETSELSGRILAEPETTLEIVAHLRYLDVVEKELLQIFEEVDYAHDVFIIIKDFAIPIDDERKEDYMDCEDFVNRTHDKLKEVQGNRGDFIQQLEDKMNHDIQSIFAETHEVYLETQQSMFLDVSLLSSYVPIYVMLMSF